MGLLEQHCPILEHLPSSAISLLFRGAVEKCEARLSVVPELMDMGVEGTALGFALQYGDVNQNVKKIERHLKSGQKLTTRLIPTILASDE